MNRLLVIKAILLCFLCTSLSVSADEKIKIAVSNTPLSSAFFIAQKNGYFAEQGLDVEFIQLNGGHRTMQLLLEGEADFATSSDMVIMNAAKKDQSFHVAATFALSSLDTLLVANKQAGITKVSDLNHKKIGLTKGTAAHYFLDTYLLLSGIDSSKVEMVNLQPEHMLDSLQNQQVEAVVTWEPWISHVQAGLGEHGVNLQDVLAYTLSFNLVASNTVKTKNSGSTEKVITALIKAEQFILEAPENAQQIVSEFISNDLAYLKNVWNKYQYRTSLDQSLLLLLESEFKWASVRNKTQQPWVNFLDYIWLAPLKRVDPTRITLIH